MTSKNPGNTNPMSVKATSISSQQRNNVPSTSKLTVGTKADVWRKTVPSNQTATGMGKTVQNKENIGELRTERDGGTNSNKEEQKKTEIWKKPSQPVGATVSKSQTKESNTGINNELGIDREVATSSSLEENKTGKSI